MKPYRAQLIIFTSPDQKLELHSPWGENAFLVKKVEGKKSAKTQWSERLNPLYIFSAPKSQTIIAVGGLGDPGTDLGVVTFYDPTGNSKVVDLKQSIPNLEDLSRAYRDLSNFPWVTAIDVTQEHLLLWICAKVSARIAFKDLKVEIEQSKGRPAWAQDPAKSGKTAEFLTDRAKKALWKRIDKEDPGGD